MWIDLFIVMSSVVGGFVVGRIYDSVSSYTLLSIIEEYDPVDAGSGQEMPSREKVNEVAVRLKEHAESMAASVDAHQTKIQAVNNSLLENDQASAEDVLGVVSELVDANKAMQRQLSDAQNRIHEQSMELESAERRAQTDSLTRIPNRRAFDQQISKQVAKGGDGESTLVILDVDHFKKFNDHHGHLAGDEVLRVVAGLLHSRLNQYGLVARYGGEEFAMIFDGVPVSEVKQLVEQTRVAISNRETEFEDKKLRVTASLGIAQYAGNETIEQWIQRADIGLYASKGAGRNCTHWMNENDPVLITVGKRVDRIGGIVSGATFSEASVIDSTEIDGQFDSEKLPACFAGLASLADLSADFTADDDGIASDMTIRVMAIRNHDSANESTMNSLLHVVRSNLRAIDRIGYVDASTLLICMPSVSEQIARERGTQICRSAAAIAVATGGKCERPVTVGIATATRSERFETSVARAISLANAGLNKKEPGMVESQTALNV